MKTASGSGLAALLLLGGLAFADDPMEGGKADLDKLVGTYRIVEGEKAGHKIPEGELREVTVNLAANAITTFDREKKQVYAATYTIDTSREPWRISMLSTLAPGKGMEAQGLIAREGDTIKLIYALPGGQPPTAFKTADKQQMFVLKKSDK